MYPRPRPSSVPLVSVAIPSYNGAKHIRDALNSVLSQSYSNIEVVVADDGSSDETADMVHQVKDHRLAYHAGEHLGSEGNWNRAISLCSGEFIKLLPQDDLIYPGCLEAQVRALREFPEAGLAASRRDVIDDSGRVLFKDRGLGSIVGFVSAKPALRAIVRSGTNPLGEGGAVLLRRATVSSVGGFSAKRPYVIDLDMWARVVAVSGVVGLPDTLAAFRVSESAWTPRLAKVQRGDMQGLYRQLFDTTGFVSRADLTLGLAKAAYLTWARRGVYRLQSSGLLSRTGHRHDPRRTTAT